jgi:hypothetical protein
MLTLLILFCIVEVVALILLTEHDRGAIATASLVGFLAVLQLYFGIDLLGFAQTHVTFIASGVILYFVMGVAWSVFKWYWWVGKTADELKEQKTRIIEDRFSHIKDVDDEKREGFWAKHVKESIPSPRHHKSKILRWMGYWPISVAWFVLNDFVREIFNHLYYRFVAIYQKISDAAINKALR